MTFLFQFDADLMLSKLMTLNVLGRKIVGFILMIAVALEKEKNLLFLYLEIVLLKYLSYWFVEYKLHSHKPE